MKIVILSIALVILMALFSINGFALGKASDIDCRDVWEVIPSTADQYVIVYGHTSTGLTSFTVSETTAQFIIDKCNKEDDK